MSGRLLDERLGKIQWGLMTAGSALLILPMFVLGLDGMRRRTADYSDMDWRPLIIVTAIGGFLIFCGIIILFYNMLHNRRHGAVAGSNPWEGRTLEWMVSSPPPAENFTSIPQVVGAPYDFGVPGSVHAIIPQDGSAAPPGKGG